MCMCEWSSESAYPTRGYLIVETHGDVTSRALRQGLIDAFFVDVLLSTLKAFVRTVEGEGRRAVRGAA
jgi:hypothetical protein